MFIVALAISGVLSFQSVEQGGGFVAPADAAQRVTFGMQCRYADGLKIALMATRQDNRFILSRQLGPNQNGMVYMTLDGHGGVAIEDEDDPVTGQAWRDAYADLKKLPLETIRGDEIQAFIARRDVAACGHKTFFWRPK